jgi:LPPG:FO 2-phospho-L-lactate transferase
VNVVVLAGGTGGAALAAGIQTAAPDVGLTVIANTADDDEFWGLLVCPDIDAVIYRLAGVFNDAAGYGLKDDTFEVLSALGRLSEKPETWFRIGDRDFATHLVRTEMLHRGCSLTETSLELGRRSRVSARVLPMTNDEVRTRFTTDSGELSFQEYYVRERLKPRLRAVEFAGIGSATPAPEAVAALDEADMVIVGPSNPLISIGPILALMRDHIRRDRTIAVTPIVAGAALKGPTVEMMRALGQEPSPPAVARLYRDIADVFVVDERDRGLAGQIESMGYRVIIRDTVMRDGGVGLARALLEFR